MGRLRGTEDSSALKLLNVLDGRHNGRKSPGGVPLKPHGEIHGVHMLGDAADGNVIHAGLRDGTNRIAR